MKMIWRFYMDNNLVLLGKAMMMAVGNGIPQSCIIKMGSQLLNKDIKNPEKIKKSSDSTEKKNTNQ